MREALKSGIESSVTEVWRDIVPFVCELLDSCFKGSGVKESCGCVVGSLLWKVEVARSELGVRVRGGGVLSFRAEQSSGERTRSSFGRDLNCCT
jgi:hypothetical protein